MGMTSSVGENTNTLARQLWMAVRDQISVFSKSELHLEALLQLQPRGSQLRLLTIIPTRWGSAFAAMQRLLQLREYIELFYTNLSGRADTVAAARKKQFQYWQVLAEVVAILEPFAIIQAIMQRRDLCMAEAWSTLLQAYVTLLEPTYTIDTQNGAGPQSVSKDALTATAKAFYDRLAREFVERFLQEASFFPDCMLMAIFLDPLHGRKVLDMLDSLRGVYAQQQRWPTPAKLLTLARVLVTAAVSELLVAEDSADAAEAPAKRAKHTPLQLPAGFRALMSVDAVSTVLNSGSKADREVLKYEQDADAVRMAVEGSSSKVFELLPWWSNRGMHIEIGDVAKRVLAMRPTSVESERNFSHAGLVLSAKRSTMKTTTVEMNLFIKQNADLITNIEKVPKLKNHARLHPTVFRLDGSVYEHETVTGLLQDGDAELLYDSAAEGDDDVTEQTDTTKVDDDDDIIDVDTVEDDIDAGVRGVEESKGSN
eukprot:2461-Heterococcus_DN1.PRE.2